MSLYRTAARSALAAMFVYGGLDAVRNPGPKVPVAKDVTEPISDRVDALPDDAEQLVRINGAVQVVGGVLFATGILRRPAAAALAATLIPTTAAGHRFWEADSGASKQQQTIHFLKNIGLLGGLLIAAADTEGEPGIAWRSQHAVDHANMLADHAREVTELRGELAKEKARARTAETRAKVGSTAAQAARDAGLALKAGKGVARTAGRVGRSARKVVTSALPG